MEVKAKVTHLLLPWLYCANIGISYLNARITYEMLTQCGLVMPYDDIDLGQHWFR